MQNVKNRLDCRKFNVSNPVTSNANGHIWVSGYKLKDFFRHAQTLYWHFTFYSRVLPSKEVILSPSIKHMNISIFFTLTVFLRVDIPDGLYTSINTFGNTQDPLVLTSCTFFINNTSMIPIPYTINNSNCSL